MLENEVAAAVRGDPQAIDRLLALLQQPVIRYCRAKLGTVNGSFTMADDVAQDVYVGVLTALPTYRQADTPILAFVFAVAGNKVADAIRVISRSRTDLVAELPDRPDAETHSPEQHLLHAEMSDEVRALLATLNPHQYQIIQLRVLVGLSAEETAKVIGSTAGAVRDAQHRAITKLRALVESAGRPVTRARPRLSTTDQAPHRSRVRR